MGNHTHKMKLRNGRGERAVYKCASCAFICTARGLIFVERLARQHTAVKAGTPQALVPWDGPVR